MIHGLWMIGLVWSWHVTWTRWLVIKVAWLWHDKRLDVIIRNLICMWLGRNSMSL